MATQKRYTDAEKIAYYKAKAKAAAAAPKGRNAKGRTAAYYKYKAQPYKRSYRQTQQRYEKNADTSSLKGVGGALGGMAGAALGGPAGAVIGSFLGGKLGHLVGQITGFGDYKVQSNSVMFGGLSPPYVVNALNKGGIIVRHREYIGDITASSAFVNTAYPINPGQSTTFPWLSGIAANFEQYRMRGCLFEFLSTSSDALLMAATSSALGTVNMATEYDSLEVNFSGKREMLNHEFANSRKPSVSFIHPVECKKDRTPVSELYVRPHGVPSGADIRLYDLGKFQIATEGMQTSTGTVGELWVTYEVELFKAKYDIATLSSGLSDHFILTGVTNALPLGTGSAPTTTSSLKGVINATTRAYTFPIWVTEGRWLIAWYVSGTGNVVATPTLTYTNCVVSNLFHNNTNNFVGTATGSNSTTITTLCCVDVTGPSATIQWSTGTLPSSVTAGDIIVTQLSYGLTLPQIVPLRERTADEEVIENTERIQQLEEERISDLEEEVKMLRQLLLRKDSKSSL